MMSIFFQNAGEDEPLISKLLYNHPFHMPGDQILTDSGLILLEDTALNSGSKLIILAFTRRKKQLSTRKIASVRIHTEKVIELIKNRYTILKRIMPHHR